MKVALLIALSICFSTIGLQAQDQRLAPARDFASYEGVLGEYYTELFELILPGLSDTPVARYLAIPSFSPESVLSVEKDRVGGYRMILRVCSRNYWYTRHKDEVDVYTYKRTIDAPLGQAIGSLFKTLAMQMREPGTPVIGFDGISYYFTATTAKGALTGKIWSPRENTPMAQLVIVCSHLSQYAAHKGPTREVLLQEITTLNSVLNSQKL